MGVDLAAAVAGPRKVRPGGACWSRTSAAATAVADPVFAIHAMWTPSAREKAAPPRRASFSEHMVTGARSSVHWWAPRCGHAMGVPSCAVNEHQQDYSQCPPRENTSVDFLCKNAAWDIGHHM